MVSVSSVTVVNRTLAAAQARSRSWRCMERIWRATFRCSEARKRHSVDCGGSLRHLQDAGQDGVASDEAELVEPRKADIEAQHEGQHKLVEAHHTGDSFDAEGFFH